MPFLLRVQPMPALDIFFGFIGLQYFTGGDVWNEVSWSMSLELYLPFLLAPLVVKISKLRSFYLSAVLMAFLAAEVFLLSFPPSVNPLYGTMRAILGLGLGYFLFRFDDSRPDLKFSPFGRWSTLVCFSGYFGATVLSDRLSPIGGICAIFAIMAILSAKNSHSVLGTSKNCLNHGADVLLRG